MATSVCVSEETRNRLLTLKMEEGYSSVENLLRDIITEHRRARLMAASKTFRERMDRKKLTVEDLIE